MHPGSDAGNHSDSTGLAAIFQQDVQFEEQPALTGDFYACAEHRNDVTRGITLCDLQQMLGSNEEQFSAQKSEQHSVQKKLADSHGPNPDLEHSSSESTVQSSSWSRSGAPILSDGLRQQLLATNVQVPRHHREVADALLGFFGVKVVPGLVPGWFIKINRDKFTMKVKTILEGLDCMIKIRIYLEQPKPGSLVEFQRRAGDSLAFMKIFKIASAFLRQEGEPAGFFLRLGLSLSKEEAISGKRRSVAHVLGEINSCQNPQLLKEMLSMLLSILDTSTTDHDSVASYLREVGAVSTFQRLAEADENQVVAWSARQVLQHLEMRCRNLGKE